MLPADGNADFEVGWHIKKGSVIHRCLQERRASRNLIPRVAPAAPLRLTRVHVEKPPIPRLCYRRTSVTGTRCSRLLLRLLKLSSTGQRAITRRHCWSTAKGRAARLLIPGRARRRGREDNTELQTRGLHPFKASRAGFHSRYGMATIQAVDLH